MPKHRERPVGRVNPSGKKVWTARYTRSDGRRRSAGTFKTKREPRMRSTPPWR
jgi:hypothetical protein